MEKYIIIFLFAGHGLQKNGMQEMVYNEFDEKKRFYRTFKAEIKLRSFAEIYPNSYVIGIFACCRQPFEYVWNENKCVSKDQYKQLTGKTFNRDLVLQQYNLALKATEVGLVECIQDVEKSK